MMGARADDVGCGMWEVGEEAGPGGLGDGRGVWG